MSRYPGGRYIAHLVRSPCLLCAVFDGSPCRISPHLVRGPLDLALILIRAGLGIQEGSILRTWFTAPRLLLHAVFNGQPCRPCRISPHLVRGLLELALILVRALLRAQEGTREWYTSRLVRNTPEVHSVSLAASAASLRIWFVASWPCALCSLARSSSSNRAGTVHPAFGSWLLPLSLPSVSFPSSPRSSLSLPVCPCFTAPTAQYRPYSTDRDGAVPIVRACRNAGGWHAEPSSDASSIRCAYLPQRRRSMKRLGFKPPQYDRGQSVRIRDTPRVPRFCSQCHH